MYLYRIRIDSGYSIIFSYVKKENISMLAQYLNDRKMKFPKEPIMNVSLVESYDDDAGIRVFTEEEYNIQFFYETYEYRLLKYYQLQNAV